MKYILIILVSFFSCTVFCQSDSIRVELSVSKVDSVINPSLTLNVKIRFDSVHSCTINKTPSLSELICGYGGCLSLTAEKLINNCFTSLLPDCDPNLPVDDKSQRIKISKGDSLFASYDISQITDKTRFPDGTLKFSGTYRIKIFFFYREGQALKRIATNWMYLF